MRAFTIKMSDVARCPIQSLSPSHYRADGSCRCNVTELSVKIRAVDENAVVDSVNETLRALGMDGVLDDELDDGWEWHEPC